MNEKLEAFPPEVVEQLKTYVYRLIDPRNGETFYVGKGQGNRVFEHARAELVEADDSDEQHRRLKRIRAIRNSGFEVGHVIHRHGMSDPIALEVEASLIDAYPGLTNVASGLDGGERGTMHAQEIMGRFRAEPADIAHRVILININRSAETLDTYEAVRFAWKIDPTRAERAEYVLAVRRGLIVGVFVAHKWVPATGEYFPDREEVPGRFGFIGKHAGDVVTKRYIGRRIPDEHRKRGAANPVRYIY